MKCRPLLAPGARSYDTFTQRCLAHESLLRPWFRLLNCVNHFEMETHRHDLAGYRYALLRAISMAPQLTFNDAPDDIPESDIEFTQKRENWARANKDYLKEGARLFDRTFRFDDVERGGDESLTGYVHIRGDRGYVPLLNPGAVEQIAELTLALDAPTIEKFVVEEIYPGGMTLQGPDRPIPPRRKAPGDGSRKAGPNSLDLPGLGRRQARQCPTRGRSSSAMAAVRG